MGISKEFIEKHILSLKLERSEYVMDVRMCHLSSLSYDFQWGRWIEGDGLPTQNGGRTDQPSKIVKVDASLNDLTEIEQESLLPFLHLKFLDCSLNRIERVCSLGQFRSLVDINLSHNKLNTISFLSTVSAVVNLNLSMNEIPDISTLPTLVSLNILHLNDNQLRSLDGIQSLPYLRELHIQRNHIQSLMPLSANRNLVCINAAHNEINSLKSTIHTLQFLSQLKSIILFGNPIERDPDYQNMLMGVQSLTSMDNVTLRKDNSHLALRTETENISNLKDAARQAFWNQLTLRRNHMEENVRFLQQRILHQQEEFKDYEARLKTDLEIAMLHLESLTLDPTNRVPLIVQTKPTPPPQSQLPNPPSSPPQREPDIQPPTPLYGLPAPKPYIKGDYRDITDTDELLRLASTELNQEKKFKRAQHN